MSFENRNYENDSRVLAGNADDWYSSFDEGSMMATVILYDDDENEEVLELPCCYEICGTCRGAGKHVNPSIDSCGLSREDFDDPDFTEDYFSGVYDVSCFQCGGKRVVPEVDREHLSEGQKAIFKRLQEKMRDDADYRNLCRQERMMGA